jgi:hypothetical protein
MNYTDYLRLNELKIFKSVRDHLPKGLTRSTNLLTVKDGVLYTWDFANNCVLTLNVKAARSRGGDNVSHQVSPISLFGMLFVSFGRSKSPKMPTFTPKFLFTLT